MQWSTGTPLDELDETALYKLLGDAWYAQFKPKAGEGHYLGPTSEMGRREFALLVPWLREGSSRPCPFGIVAWVTNSVQRSGTWRMPANLVAALAVKQGLTPSILLSIMGRNRVSLAESPGRAIEPESERQLAVRRSPASELSQPKSPGEFDNRYA